MKLRARRITIAAAGLGAVLVAVLVVTHWGTVRDHVEAWHFQLTRQTQTIAPKEMTKEAYIQQENALLHMAANELRVSVVFDPHETPTILYKVAQEGLGIMELMERNGWRVLEQYFPRRAYVIVQWDVSTLPKCVVCNKDILDIDNVPVRGHEDGLVIMLCSDSCFARYVKKQRMGASGTELKAAASGTPRAEKH